MSRSLPARRNGAPGRAGVLAEHVGEHLVGDDAGRVVDRVRAKIGEVDGGGEGLAEQLDRAVGVIQLGFGGLPGWGAAG